MMFLEAPGGFPEGNHVFNMFFSCLIIFFTCNYSGSKVLFNKTCSCFLQLVVWWVRGGGVEFSN